ncbi:RecQ family ATP-dependent DNA helicase [Kordia sp. YSTF-M3]|uniref:DNA 3'-5' helicase n=1 Tax=Kordia aestuariivivens TaxID=2759037 RepID=A0ABR7Q5S1_9FLAO|nr:RecQ family ATP-dependent DNA helicase [Kordia aestuariivivens]MBC8753909.1 RecQ family ATP-dependent DNA helicase [Kordia aestuariivivens]
MNTKILYIDLETTLQGKIKDVGALFNRQELHGNDFAKLTTWIQEADYICGHNIVAHDIPILKKKLGVEIFHHKKLVDTLLWSPIIFNENPYHKLVKGYKIVNDSDYNNPLSDCKLTKILLSEELNAFNTLKDVEKMLYSVLLSKSKNYAGFLELTSFRSNNIFDQIPLKELFKDTICNTTNITEIAQKKPIELAYAFSLIRAKESSILPNWVQKTFPETQRVLDVMRFNFCGKTNCNYCNTNLNPRKALETYFGYDNFRSFDPNEAISLQEKTVSAGLGPASFVAVFPTGGGKSLTFQLPALMKGDSVRQLTVVISPLVSLMKDQVDNLERKFGITKAIAINGLLSPLERQDAIERVENGDIQLLYISPESLRSPTILRILRERSIARFVIDEAHCFSSWGQDFRVDYLYIGNFIKSLEAERLYTRIPVSCFTATAKPQVIEDIKAYFQSKLNIQLKEYVTRASRVNLKYEVIDIKDPNQKMASLFSVLDRCEKPAIIYASRTKRVEEIHRLITEANFEATYFHGKLNKDVKTLHMDAFMNGSKDIIVATSAFGMGVDKDDIKSVIHYNISDSLENYVQEAGRAGRDEKIEAKCYILFNEDDLNKHFSLLQQTKINQKEIQQVWQALKYLSKYRISKKISNSALEIAQKAGWDTEIKDLETKVKTSIAALEDRGFLKRKQNSSRVFANSLLVPNLKKALNKLHENTTVTETQIDQCSRVLQRIIKDDECRVDYLSDRTGLTLKEIRNVIDILRELQILGDARDLTAFISLVQSANGSKNILQRYLKLEVALQQFLTKDLKISMRALNQNLLDKGVEKTSITSIKNILNYWEIRRFIDKRRIDRDTETYQIKVKNNEAIAKDIQLRHELAVDSLEILIKLYTAQQNQITNQDKRDLPVGFSMLGLKKQNESSGFFGETKNATIKQYERALLFLNQIKSIQLEGGFMVFYNRFNIEDIDDSIPRFTKDNFEKMDTHYRQRTEQIHIVGEYAKRRLQNYESAITFVNNYFSQSYDEFIRTYFPRRKTEISRPVSPKRFEEILGKLDVDQIKIVNDGNSDNILVLAGPGSGKTKVLVHKIASLLLLEDIKPEQFLMLTFSKAASLEFRSRAYELVPEYAGFIKITTFHGFCFQLLGQLGDLEKSQNIIKDCIQAIKDDEIDITSIENKSVLLLDEFQDINAEEWELIQLIIEKSEKIKVIAVGDDDQNIYEFRGSSNKHMLSFQRKPKTVTYKLIKNYRSSAEIVEFNNELLQSIPMRLKDQTLVSVKDPSSSKIKLIRYTSKYLEKSLVDQLIADDYPGTRAVLVRTNKQALMVQTFLKSAGQKTKLITGLQGFRLADLYELRSFTAQLQKNKNDGGFILESLWNKAKRIFSIQHETSIHLETCLAVISKFEVNYPKYRLLVDWYDYIREINMEDAINADVNAIIIATMHKSKGKEFDHVYLLLEDFNFAEIASKRALYVGCSRAKESLQLHCNAAFFDEFKSKALKFIDFTGVTQQPSNFEIVLGHKDIYLKSQKGYGVPNRISTLVSGEKLKKDIVKFSTNEALGLAKMNNGNISIFSKGFMEKTHAIFEKDGYQMISGSVEYLVFWYDKDEEKEYKIVLPRLSFTKTSTEN